MSKINPTLDEVFSKFIQDEFTTEKIKAGLHTLYDGPDRLYMLAIDLKIKEEKDLMSFAKSLANGLYEMPAIKKHIAGELRKLTQENERLKQNVDALEQNVRELTPYKNYVDVTKEIASVRS